MVTHVEGHVPSRPLISATTCLGAGTQRQAEQGFPHALIRSLVIPEGGAGRANEGTVGCRRIRCPDL